jgi:hypothetical protein
MSGRYQTAAQLVETIGGINVRTVRTMRAQGLPAVKLGKAYLYDPEKALAWIAAREEALCPVQTSVRASSPSPAALPSTSSGMKPGKSGAAALARQTVERLKGASRGSSANASSQSAPPVQLIRRATP